MSDDVRADVSPDLGKLSHREASDTAATVGKPLYGPSGVQSYRVMLQTPGGMTTVDVEAATGDDAASQGLSRFPGGKVANVTPTPQAA